MKFMFLNMILGWCSETYCPFFPVGIHILDFTFTGRESVLGWGSRLDGLEATAGVGITGDVIGTMARLCMTTTGSFLIVERSQTETAPIQ
jgi:hypothetical protein